MGELDGGAAVQVSDGPGHPQDAVIAAGGEPHPVKGPLHQPLALRVQGAEPVQLLLAHQLLYCTWTFPPILLKPDCVYSDFTFTYT